MAKKENKTSIDLVTVELSKDKVDEIKGYNGKLQQVMTQLGQIHIRKNELHSELEKIDEAVEKNEKLVSFLIQDIEEIYDQNGYWSKLEEIVS